MSTETTSVFTISEDENLTPRLAHWSAGALTVAGIGPAVWAVERTYNGDILAATALSVTAIGVGCYALRIIAKAEAPNYFREIFPDLNFKFPAE